MEPGYLDGVPAWVFVVRWCNSRLRYIMMMMVMVACVVEVMHLLHLVEVEEVMVFFIAMHEQQHLNPCCFPLAPRPAATRSLLNSDAG